MRDSDVKQEIERMTENIKAGAEQQGDDDKDYSIGTREGYEKFASARNQSLGQKRIEEFAKQADAIPIHGEPRNRALVGYDNIQRFAELIVLECSRIAELKEQKDRSFHPDTSAGWYIRQHFGVD